MKALQHIISLVITSFIFTGCYTQMQFSTPGGSSFEDNMESSDTYIWDDNRGAEAYYGGERQYTANPNAYFVTEEDEFILLQEAERAIQQVDNSLYFGVDSLRSVEGQLARQNIIINNIGQTDPCDALFYDEWACEQQMRNEQMQWNVGFGMGWGNPWGWNNGFGWGNSLALNAMFSWGNGFFDPFWDPFWGFNAFSPWGFNQSFLGGGLWNRGFGGWGHPFGWNNGFGWGVPVAVVADVDRDNRTSVMPRSTGRQFSSNRYSGTVVQRNNADNSTVRGKRNLSYNQQLSIRSAVMGRSTVRSLSRARQSNNTPSRSIRSSTPRSIRSTISRTGPSTARGFSRSTSTGRYTPNTSRDYRRSTIRNKSRRTPSTNYTRSSGRSIPKSTVRSGSRSSSSRGSVRSSSSRSSSRSTSRSSRSGSSSRKKRN